MGMASWPPKRKDRVPGYERYQLMPDGIERKGSQGIVIPALESGKLVAIKFFRESTWENCSEELELFRQEASAGIRHRSDFLGHSYEILDLRKYRDHG
jgi:hypothetical protein